MVNPVPPDMSGSNEAQKQMPPSKAPGGIFVGLSTTNWAFSPGIEAFAHTALPAAAFLRPTCPGGPDYLNRSRPSSLFPVRFTIHPPREDVAKTPRKAPELTIFQPFSPSPTRRFRIIATAASGARPR